MRPPPLRLRWGTASRDMRAKKSSDRCTAVAHCSSVASCASASGGPPGVVHEDVEAPEAIDCCGDQIANRVVPIQVSRERKDVNAGRAANFLGRSFQVRP